MRGDPGIERGAWTSREGSESRHGGLNGERVPLTVPTSLEMTHPAAPVSSHVWDTGSAPAPPHCEPAGFESSQKSNPRGAVRRQSRTGHRAARIGPARPDP